MAELRGVRRAEPIVCGSGAGHWGGLLLLHGFMGAPDELADLATAAASAGLAVRAPVLPGHGGAPSELAGVGWRRWHEAAARELAALRAGGGQVFVAGYSMGGLLGILLAAGGGPGEVSGLALLAPALRMAEQRLLALSGAARHVVPWLYPLRRADFADPAVQANVRQHLPDADLTDPALVARLRAEVRIPVGAVAELMALQGRARRELRSVTAPLLVLQGRRDTTVDPASAELAIAGARSKDKKLVWLENSGHMLTREAERGEVARELLAWLAERRRA